MVADVKVQNSVAAPMVWRLLKGPISKVAMRSRVNIVTYPKILVIAKSKTAKISPSNGFSTWSMVVVVVFGLPIVLLGTKRRLRAITLRLRKPVKNIVSHHKGLEDVTCPKWQVLVKLPWPNSISIASGISAWNSHIRVALVTEITLKLSKSVMRHARVHLMICLHVLNHLNQEHAGMY